MKHGAKVMLHQVGVAPDVASDGKDFFVVWSRQGDVMGLPIDASGAPRHPVVICGAGNGGGHDPAITFDEKRGRYAVVWDGEAGEVRGAFVTQGGSVSPPGGLVVNAPGPLDADGEPAVACHGELLVAWRGGTGRMFTLATRMKLDGTVLDPQPISLLQGARAPNDRPWVAALGSGFLVAVAGDRPGTGAWVYTVLVSSAGVASPGPSLPIARQGGQLLSPAVCTGPYPATPIGPRLVQQDLIVWFELQADTCLRCARVDASGTLLDPAGIDVAAGSAQPGAPAAVAADADGYLVVWPHGSEIWGTRVGRNGGVATPGGQPLIRATDARPRSASNGKEHLVVWQQGWAVVT